MRYYKLERSRFSPRQKSGEIKTYILYVNGTDLGTIHGERKSGDWCYVDNERPMDWRWGYSRRIDAIKQLLEDKFVDAI